MQVSTVIPKTQPLLLVDKSGDPSTMGTNFQAIATPAATPPDLQAEPHAVNAASMATKGSVKSL